MKNFERKNLLFSLCGLNCYLCPMYNDKYCPGCGGGQGNQSCAIAKCSIEKGIYQYCYKCQNFPCKKYENIDNYDSFITHKHRNKDIELARKIGIEKYNEILKKKRRYLKILLENYNSGRKKTFFYLAINLLDLEDIENVMFQLKTKEVMAKNLKDKSEMAVKLFEEVAQQRKIELKLRRKPKKNNMFNRKEDVKMAFDYKKEYKEFYMPKNKPSIVKIPKMNYIAVRGKGNPNEEQSEYKDSIGLLYGIAFTIKMSYKGNHKIEGYFDFVVPPLEGFWWQEGNNKGIDYKSKDKFNFISMIRMPDFVTKEDFDWAIQEATKKKKQDFSKVEFLSYDEGLCVQCMHIGSYDDEPATIEEMHEFAKNNGYELDITDTRYHHEIYLSDPKKCDVNKLKTVVRHPIKQIQ